MQSNANTRASLLSGLRTGGVRSASQPAIVPHTAAVGGSFNVPRFPPFPTLQTHYVDEEVDELAEMTNHHLHLNGTNNHRMMPATAALDGSTNRFHQQQQAAFLQQMAAQRSTANGIGFPTVNGMDPIQMQLMQLEIMKLQAIQQAQQQYQAELLAQNQRQQQHSQRLTRRVSAFGEPATAGPRQTSFDLHTSAQLGRDSIGHEQDVPKTAALSGKFGGRPVLSALNPNASIFTMATGDEPGTPKTATPGSQGRTTVISGGTSLGGASGAVHIISPATPSKSDSAATWRRTSAAANAPSTPTRPSTTLSSLSSPALRIPTAGDDGMAPSPLRQRPSPLRFHDGGGSVSHLELEPGTESDIDSYTSDMAQLAASSASISDAEKDSSPGTPPSAGSSSSLTREEASKRLYEGLGMGRPSHAHIPPVHVPIKQQVTQVLRQPRGPPASVDELGPRNFAARMHKRLNIVAGEI